MAKQLKARIKAYQEASKPLKLGIVEVMIHFAAEKSPFRYAVSTKLKFKNIMTHYLFIKQLKTSNMSSHLSIHRNEYSKMLK